MIITLKNGELSYKQHVLVLNYTNSERHCVDKYTTFFFPDSRRGELFGKKVGQ